MVREIVTCKREPLRRKDKLLICLIMVEMFRLYNIDLQVGMIDTMCKGLSLVGENNTCDDYESIMKEHFPHPQARKYVLSNNKCI